MSTSDESINELLEELEQEDERNDDFIDRSRAQRMQEMHDYFGSIQRKKEEGFGKVNYMDNESQVMKITTSTARVVIHFELETFKKCQYMDEKLEEIAKNYLSTKFISISVENAPFLVEKLGIKVLPFVICYLNGNECERIIGFNKMGNDPNGFRTSKLEGVLMRAGILERRPQDADRISNLRIANKNTDLVSKLREKNDSDTSDLDI